MNKVQVVAKKITITKSIIQQLTAPSNDEIKDCEVFGFCMWQMSAGRTKGFFRMIVLQSKDLQLRKMKMFDEVVKSDDVGYYRSSGESYEGKEVFRIEVTKQGFNSYTQRFYTEEERDEVYNNLMRAKRAALEKGQFLY